MSSEAVGVLVAATMETVDTADTASTAAVIASGKIGDCTASGPDINVLCLTFFGNFDF